MFNRNIKKKQSLKKNTEITTTTINTTLRFKDITNKDLCKLSNKIYKIQPMEKKRNNIIKKNKTALNTPKKSSITLNFNKIISNKSLLNQAIFYQKKNYTCSSPLNIQLNNKNKNHYKMLHQIGSGGFGSVWKVEQIKTKKLYAMKQISKAKVIMKKSVSSVINEKNILNQLNNTFIINKYFAFQNRDYLYLIMQYLKGGDLRYHLCYYQCFNESQTKFIISCIILSLQYIHSQNIIHRDIKPQNLVFQENGYIRLTDFGVACKYKSNNSHQTSGTPGYMAPEVICRMNHSYEADFFALGVILFEMITGKRPYQGDSRQEIRDKILAHQAKLNHNNTPNDWSSNCVDFVNKLLQRSKDNRLGAKGIHELKEHAWLKEVNWNQLANKKLVPPFVPGVITETYQYERQMQVSHQTTLDEETKMLLRTNQIQHLFENYKQIKNTSSKLKSRKIQLI